MLIVDDKKNGKSFVMVLGAFRTARIAGVLVRESAWFNVDPYPDGEWLVTVKLDRKHSLEKAIEET